MDTRIKQTISNLFIPNQKCIINTDLDGILSGMLLSKFLNWDVIGFSSCCGKITDELWLKDDTINLKSCIFIDLPVWVRDFSTIDQHFVAFDLNSINEYINSCNKLNPNVLRTKVFKDTDGKSNYTNKYPFGTVHFVLAMLEYLDVIPKTYKFGFRKIIGQFDMADLLLRADRVIGNTYSYTPNCFDWINWICKIGKANTNELFSIVKNEYISRKNKEPFVEKKLLSLGCIGSDGDCSNMLRNKEYKPLEEYFSFLSQCTDLPTIDTFYFKEYAKLYGTRFNIYSNLNNLKIESKNNNVFSFAFVSMKVLSMTYFEK